MDFGQLAIDALRDHSRLTQTGMEIGRQQAYREVLSIIGMACARKDFAVVVAEIQELCKGRK